ncbi:MAG: RHS repeat protein, partial [Deltaproteobacteria bacterium]|nr:RHS repeat protein [Deltaproteobacteria bacterium]
IDYSDSTPDVNFTYDQVGNRLTMNDDSDQTGYSYDNLYRLTGVNDGAGQQVGYSYDEVGNRKTLTYPDNKSVTYTYDDANRLDTVTTDWLNGQFGYNYDDANRLDTLNLPNGLTSNYDYDDAGRLRLLTHSTVTDTLAGYDYALDNVGNRRVLTETLITVPHLPLDTYLENSGLVVMEAENGESTNGLTHNWLLKTSLPNYTGTSYLEPSLDNDTLISTEALTTSPRADYPVNV